MAIIKLKLEKELESTIGHPIIEIIHIVETDQKALCRIRDENELYEGIDFVNWPDLRDEIIVGIYIEFNKTPTSIVGTDNE